jgi:hypothetical protein
VLGYHGQARILGATRRHVNEIVNNQRRFLAPHGPGFGPRQRGRTTPRECCQNAGARGASDQPGNLLSTSTLPISR